MFLGLDLGTSGLKALLVDGAERIVAETVVPLRVSRPHDGWVEQDPNDWFSACADAIAGLEVDLSAVQGIGLSGHMHGATLLDAAGTSLRPCMLWNDTRAAAQAAAMDADPFWRAVTGNIVFPGFTAPKLAWVRDHEPDIFARIDKVLLPKDALRFWLTGDAVSDMSDAAGTSWLDTGARDWSDALLERSGLTRSQMPSLVEGSQVSGHLSGSIAGQLGLPAGIPVAGGGGDNAASAIGMGVVKPGQAFVSLGTSGVLFAPTPSYAAAPQSALHSFCHALPDLWHQMGVILSATDSLNWLAGVLNADAQQLTADLGPLQAPGRTIFMPYLGGERTPHNDAHVRGGFLHLAHHTDRDALTRAVLEGVTHALRDSFDAMTQTGTKIDSLIAVGGGSKSDYWLKAIATSLNMPIQLPAAGDFGGALGAARLGRMAATGEGAELAVPPPISRTIEPDANLVDTFAEAHGRYADAYRAVKFLR
ncbi:MAG: xylulokinase [Sulfitobacter sp.]|uniref:xylulokinase n=4 Tax=Sulfitobacter sp. TaxID=1903071 RepID=UPI0040586204